MMRIISTIALAVACLVTLVGLFIYGVPVKVPDSNQFLDDFVGSNWIFLLLWWSIFRAMFPNSKFLASMGTSLSSLFPVLKQNETSKKTTIIETDKVPDVIKTETAILDASKTEPEK